MCLKIFAKRLWLLFFSQGGFLGLSNFFSIGRHNVVNVWLGRWANTGYVLHHLVVRSWAHFYPHGQDVPLKYPKWSAKRREVFAVLLQVHLVESILEVNERK